MWRGEGKVLALQNTAGKGVVCDTSLNEKIFPLIVGHVFTGSPHLKGGGDDICHIQTDFPDFSLRDKGGWRRREMEGGGGRGG